MKRSEALSRWKPLAGWLILSLGVLFLCAPLISGQQTLAFRDAGHYYFRLYQWQAECLQRGESLMWNPKENLGQPQHGDVTASLFYPAKAWLWWGVGDFAWRWNLYLLGHFVWAAIGAVWLARVIHLRGLAPFLVAICYVGSGVVLIQACNVIYLVGAAWLPWAIGCGLRGIESLRWRWAVLGGACLALMVMGGDPQSAYHVGLILVARLLFLRRQPAPHDEQARGANNEEQGLPFETTAVSSFAGRLRSALASPEDLGMAGARWLARRRNALAILALMAVVGLILSWVQVWSSVQVAGGSERNLWQHPRSLTETVAFWNRSSPMTPQQKFDGSLAGLLLKPQPGTHHDFAFQFSLPPWQLVELIWPNASGRVYPEHGHWTQHIPAGDRVWYPSLYMGVLPLVLALVGLLRRSSSNTHRWIKCVLLWFLLASMGWYGLGWIGKEVWVNIARQDPQSYAIGSPVGGLYWLMTVWLPGYIQFRFPAKLMIVATLAIALLAGVGWRELTERGTVMARRIAGCLALLSALAWVASRLLRERWWAWLADAADDSVFGPLQREVAWQDLQWSLLQGLFLSLTLYLFWRCQLHRSPSITKFVGCLALILTVLDLGWAHRSLLPTANVEAWNSASPVAKKVLATDTDNLSKPESFEPQASLSSVYRATMDHWTPRSWWGKASDQRMQQVIRWDSDTLFPKHHLRYPIGLVESPGAMTTRQHWLLLQRSRAQGPARLDGMREPELNWLSALGARSLLIPNWSTDTWAAHSDRLQIQSQDGEWPEDCLLLINQDALPTAWIVEDAFYSPFSFGTDLQKGWQQSQLVLRDERTGEPRDFRSLVIVHQPLLQLEQHVAEFPNNDSVDAAVELDDNGQQRWRSRRVDKHAIAAARLSLETGLGCCVSSLSPGLARKDQTTGLKSGVDVAHSSRERCNARYRP